MPASTGETDLLQLALARIDEENGRDPNTEIADGTTQPREQLYARRLTGWVLKLAPNASEHLQLAARCQHIRRWEVPRQSHPMTKAGYLRWRTELKQFHAKVAGELLAGVGYGREVIEKVRDLNLKKNFPHDPESQVMEDALCLVFLEHQFAALAAKSDDAKMINALKKAWGKMSPAARAHALALPYGPNEQRLLALALEPKTSD